MSTPPGSVPGFEPPSYEQTPYPGPPPDSSQLGYPVPAGQFYQQPPPGLPGYPGMAGIGAVKPVPRPRSITLACWLVLAGAAVITLMYVLAVTLHLDDLRQGVRESLAEDGPYTEDEVGHVLSITLVVYAVMLGIPMAGFVTLGFLMRGGRNWARVTLTVFLGIGMLFLLIVAIFPIAIVVRLLVVVGIGLCIGAVVAMFQRTAGPYFDPRAKLAGWAS